MSTDVQTLTLAGERFVVLPEATYRELTGGAAVPPLPPRDERGYLPALEALDVSIARSIVARRRALGLTQAELARRARIRPETLNRLEHAKHTPTVATVERLDRALAKAEGAEGKAARSRRRGRPLP